MLTVLHVLNMSRRFILDHHIALIVSPSLCGQESEVFQELTVCTEPPVDSVAAVLDR